MNHGPTVSMPAPPRGRNPRLPPRHPEPAWRVRVLIAGVDLFWGQPRTRRATLSRSARRGRRRLGMNPEKAQRSRTDKYVFVERRPGRMLMRIALVVSVLVMCVGAMLALVERSIVTIVVTGA